MIDVESSPEIVLPLLPAGRQCRQLLVLSGARHVLVQKGPIRLHHTRVGSMEKSSCFAQVANAGFLSSE